jgi:hypothetical protein
MTPRQKAKKLAPLLNPVIDELIADRDYEKEQGDCDGFASMFAQDAKDMRKIRSLLNQGKLKEASEKGIYMDTEVREKIPKKVFDFLLDIEYGRI